jgi:hypothetical protein
MSIRSTIKAGENFHYYTDLENDTLHLEIRNTDFEALSIAHDKSVHNIVNVIIPPEVAEALGLPPNKWQEDE